MKPQIGLKYLVVPIAAGRICTVDNYENGCALESKYYTLPHGEPRETLSQAISDIVGANIKSKDIRTFDPNTYCDTKQGVRTVEDNESRGCFRALYDRMENKRGRPPTEQEKKDFESGKINLFLVDYELLFHIRIVGLDEDALADFCGVSSPNGEWRTA